MIFQIDFQWLGSGIIRYFIHINGIPILLHVMENRYKDVPYMKSGDLPIRYEITKTGNNTNTGEMRQICSAIQIESGYNLLGFQKFEPILAQTNLSITSTVLVPIFSIRLKSNCNRSFIKNFRFNIINNAASGTPIYVAILLNPTFGSALTWVDKSNSIIQYSTTVTTVNNLSTVEYIYQDYIQGNTNRASYNDALTEIFTPLTSSISGVSDILSICVARLAGNATINAGFNWIEYH